MSILDTLTDIYLQIDSDTALDKDMITKVNATCERVEDANKDVILLVHLRGGDGAGDGWPHDVGVHTVNQWERAVRRLEKVPALSVAVVEGPCYGLALEVMLTADYRIATPDATLRAPSGAES